MCFMWYWHKKAVNILNNSVLKDKGAIILNNSVLEDRSVL